MTTQAEYELVTVQNLASAFPRSAYPLVTVRDAYGIEVRSLRAMALRDDDHDAVLAGDSVTLRSGRTVELVREP